MQRLSVIICTHNPREDYLRRTLDALRAQTLPVDQWELLLIDNASVSPLVDRVDLSWHPEGKCLREEKLGLTPARLRGINESRADVIVFADDDTLLDSDYLEKALIVGNQWPFVGAWGGTIEPEYEIQPPDWIGNQAWRLTIVDVKEDVWSNSRLNFDTIPAGAGMCIRRTVGVRFVEWCQLNNRSVTLDRKGKGLSGYGDVDLAFCAMDLGLGTGKSTQLRLKHLIPSSRLTLDYFLRHAEGDAMSLMMFRAIRELPLKDPRQTFSRKLRWCLYKIVSTQPAEVLKIQDAYQRGVERGYQMALDYLKEKQPGLPAHES
jgi:glycosyltransferase involved in cell wall biosynthesis